MGEDVSELSDRTALLWGRREEQRRRGPRPALSLADITRAAVAVADAEGLAAVSMSRVAAELGNATMALYRHVRSKDELLALLADAALDEPPAEALTGDWRADVRTWAHGALAAATRHPWAARLPVAGPPLGPRNLAWFDRILAALEPTGLSAGERVAISMAVLTHVQGQARLGADLAAGWAEDPDAFGAGYGRQLGLVVDPHRMPALARVVADGVFDGAPDGTPPSQDDAVGAEEFDLGVTFLLDGNAAYVAGRG